MAWLAAIEKERFMEIKITTLSEDTANRGFLAESGLSMLIEADGLKVLFDTGASISAVHNAQLMGIDLSAIDRIVLSHGHYDHTGGLREVLMRAGHKEVIAHPAVWQVKCERREGALRRYIGIPFVREGLEVMGASFKLSAEPVKLSARVMTTGEIPVVTDYEVIDTSLVVKEGEEIRQDSLNDDLAMVIDADFGLVVILGCAHRGIINTLKQAQKITGKELIYAAIGGTHLLHASEERLEKTAAALMEMGVQYLGVSHCTGFVSSAYLLRQFGDRFFLNNAGTRLTLPFP
jgi:7,8-dihydropterin-6-yl-methyl-4-(beta-D-ribofuranosyl)aminobenzene 5'-phosphate synthase